MIAYILNALGKRVAVGADQCHMLSRRQNGVRGYPELAREASLASALGAPKEVVRGSVGDSYPSAHFFARHHLTAKIHCSRSILIRYKRPKESIDS